ncbi:hypothetical protein AB0L35_20850 [Streptomyces sp. NPDC052309]|uniref:hypothetical protein n=1 Tax=Streptomyces sp. NPDC052309 TaxID=3155421 RepID=UPI0034259FD8
MTVGWGCRATRAAVFAAVCVLLAALGHRMMSDSTVPWWAIAAALAGAGGMAWCLTGRERGLPLVASAAMAAQTALHVWYSLAETAARPHRPAPAMPAAHHHALSNGTPLEHMAHQGPMDPDMAGMSSTGMVAAHLLAALLCSLWLAYGERAAFRILRTLAGWLLAPLRTPLLPPAPPHRPRVHPRRNRSARTPRQVLLVHAITSRGPPAGTAVV